MMRQFLDKPIGAGHPVFICAEAGINHNGNFDLALKMIDVAKDCGADAVKFQKRDMRSLYRKSALENPTVESHSLGVYIPIIKQCELSEDDHVRLWEHCQEIGIKYFCSPWDIASVNFLESIKTEAYKVPSACFSDVYLVNRIAKTGKPVILSTGMHCFEEIKELMTIYQPLLKDRMALMHCVSSYPTANRDVNLGFMKVLADTFDVPVGYSGHERGVPISVAAVARGAVMLERHFTLDRTMKGPDHASSLEPHGLEELIRHVRAVEEACGYVKKVNQGEIVARETLGKVLTWARDHKIGEIVDETSFCATSPGYGIPAYRGWQILVKQEKWEVLRDVFKGNPVQNEDAEYVIKRTSKGVVHA